MNRTDLFKIGKLVYGAKVIVKSLYGSLQCQTSCCKGNCNKIVRQLTGKVYGARAIVMSLYGSLQGQSL